MGVLIACADRGCGSLRVELWVVTAGVGAQLRHGAAGVRLNMVEHALMPCGALAHVSFCGQGGQARVSLRGGAAVGHGCLIVSLGCVAGCLLDGEIELLQGAGCVCLSMASVRRLCSSSDMDSDVCQRSAMCAAGL